MMDAMTVIKTGEAEKRGRAKGLIHYEVGHSPGESSGLQIRITENSSTGKFSKKWNRVQELMDAAQEAADDDGVFLGVELKDFIVGNGANDVGFTLLVLRAEGLVVSSPLNPSRPMISPELTVKAWTESLTGKKGGAGKGAKPKNGSSKRRGISLDESKETNIGEVLNGSGSGSEPTDEGEGG